jgi:hypothetical protein
MEEYIREVCDHLDIIEDELSTESVDVNTHASIVKFIERHIEMECAEADEMELNKALDSAVSVASDDHPTAADASHDAMSIETVIHPDESNSTASKSVLTTDVTMESELI